MEIQKQRELPDKTQQDSASLHCDFDKLKIDSGHNRVTAKLAV
jgi:hypothetical protein